MTEEVRVANGEIPLRDAVDSIAAIESGDDPYVEGAPESLYDALPASDPRIGETPRRRDGQTEPSATTGSAFAEARAVLHAADAVLG